ncbi:MAG: asparagine synthetase B family protein, partial [Anaerovoracaceae bacterium]
TIYAEELSKMLNIGNTKKLITPDEFFEALPKVQYHSDEPHANLSNVPLYYLAELAAKDLKVVLSGEGADEFFGGYITYGDTKVCKAYRKMPLTLRKGLGKVAKKLPAAPGRNFLVRNSSTVEETYIGQAFIMNNEEANVILKEDYRSDMRYQDVTKPYFDMVKDKDEMTKKMFLDMNLWLPSDIFLKADKITMAHSLELRVPYMDRVLWSLARQIPTKYLMKGDRTKYVFRKCAEEKLPEEWWNREKIGFPVPFVKWIREEKYYNIVREMFLEKFTGEFFDQEIILDMLDEHIKGREGYGRKIYTIFAFLTWYKEYFVTN